MSIFARSGNLKDFYRQAPISSIIILINTAVVLAVLVSGGFSNGLLPQSPIINWGVIRQSAIFGNNEYYRLISGAFLHGSLWHYGSNMIIGLVVLGSALERLIGSKKFAVIYFGSLVISSLGVAAFSIHDTLGASGAIFGVLGSFLYITFFRKDLLHHKDIQAIWVLVALDIFMTFTTPGISVLGHVGGLIAGFIISFFLIKRFVFKVLS